MLTGLEAETARCLIGQQQRLLVVPATRRASATSSTSWKTQAARARSGRAARLTIAAAASPARVARSTRVSTVSHVVRAGAVPKRPGVNLPAVVILVVDDSDDDKLVSIIANADTAPTEDFGGSWRGTLSGAVTFTLTRLSGGFERQWPLTALAQEIVDASVQDHYVAVLPEDLAGDLSNFTADDLNRLRGGMIVATYGTQALALVWDERGS
jgi:hypothetical protein